MILVIEPFEALALARDKITGRRVSAPFDNFVHPVHATFCVCMGNSLTLGHQMPNGTRSKFIHSSEGDGQVTVSVNTTLQQFEAVVGRHKAVLQ